MPAGIQPSDFYNILPELVITAGSLVVLIADVLLGRNQRVALGWLTLAVIGATAVSLAPFSSTHVEIAHGLLAVDRFALFFKIVFLAAAAITVLMSFHYLDVEGAPAGEYYFLILCATLGMMIMAGGIDLITIFIGLETMAVSFYILAGFIKPISPRRISPGPVSPSSRPEMNEEKCASLACTVRCAVSGLSQETVNSSSAGAFIRTVLPEGSVTMIGSATESMIRLRRSRSAREPASATRSFW